MAGDTSAAAAAELKRGWPIILAALIGTGCGISAVPMFTVGVFTNPLGEAFGWSRAQVQGVISFFVLGALFGSPLVGWLMDRHGVRPVTLASTAGMALLFVALGTFTQSLAAFYSLALVIGVIGAGTTSVTWSRAIMAWFEARRGFALGLALTGSGIAGAILPLYATWLEAAFGWRIAYTGLAVLPGLLALPAAAFLLRMPTTTASAAEAPPVAGVNTRAALADRRFWLIGLGLFLAGLGTSGIVAHLIPLLTDRGFAPSDAAQVASALGLAILTGRVVTGYLMDRLWAPGLAAGVLLVPAVSCLVLAGETTSVALLTAAAVVVGFAGGAEFDLLAYLCSRYFGLKHYGAIYGSLYALFVTASGMAPPLFGWVFDTQGAYDQILYISAGGFIAGASMLLVLGPYPRTFAKP
ncbi:MAG: MFS transporter [Rhodospirillaceae bacterium]|nr:MFS transporter [Rhodospirillaceae bacterium]